MIVWHRYFFYKFRLIKSDLLPTINGIPQLLHQLFLNILMNAVKYRKKEVQPAIDLQYEMTQIGAEVYHKI